MSVIKYYFSNVSFQDNTYKPSLVDSFNDENLPENIKNIINTLKYSIVYFKGTIAKYNGCIIKITYTSEQDKIDLENEISMTEYTDIDIINAYWSI